MLPITDLTRLLTLAVLFAFPFCLVAQSSFNDECEEAYYVPISYDPCDLEYVSATNEGATDSSPYSGEPSSACGNTYEGGDVWFWVDKVPASGNLLVKIDADPSLKLVVEAYIGSCQNQLRPQGCTDFYKESFLLLTDLDPGFPIYLRVWNSHNDVTGDFSLAVQWVPEDISQLELCDEYGGKYPANQFIVQFDENADEQEFQELFNFLIANWAFVDLKECDCGPEKMQLWTISEGEVALLDDARKGSQQKAGVDTTEYNFSIRDYLNGNISGNVIPEPKEPGYRFLGGEGQVRVGVIDSGVDYNHNELQDALWKNDDQSQDCVPGVEIGYDFVHQDPLPNDIDGHGTAVNGIFIMDYPTNIKLDLMNMKFYENVGYVFDAICAMQFLIDKKADILNLSWGFYRDRIPYILDQALRRSQYQDILVVTSAGNEGLDNDVNIRWPSNAVYDNVITVAAAEVVPGDTTLAFYSNYGQKTVDLAANGYFSTLAPPNSQITVAGTSLSAPFVARTASIIRGKYPNLKAAEIRGCLLKAVRYLPAFSGKLLTEGMLDEEEALLCAEESATPLSTTALQLSAKQEDNAVFLQWFVHTDEPIQQFTIQHSTNGKSWQELGTVATIFSKKNYAFTAKNPDIGQNYYRLLWQNERNEWQESQIVTVEFIPAFRIFPNPVSKTALTIQTDTEQTFESIALYNAAGQLVAQEKSIVKQLTYIFQLPELPAGVYSLHLKTKQQVITEKIIVNQ